MSTTMPSAEVAAGVESKPRSRRVGIASPPAEFNLVNFTSSSSSPPSPYSPSSPSSLSSPPASPPLPPRSPLRPPTRSIYLSDQNRPRTPPDLDWDDFAQIAEAAIPLSFQMADRSFPSLDGLLDALTIHSEDALSSKALSLRPDSPLSLSLDDPGSSSSSLAVQQPPLTKRQHALHELLSSERAYASDLALIREVHIPLAIGQTAPLHSIPVSPPNSSASSSRTLSTASDSSTASLGPPMTLEDSKIIFSNIAELAIFSDLFCEALEEALGSVVEGGDGEDRVGALFLKIAPELERPYKHYITRHPTALNHLQALPQTPALTAYLAHTQTIASSLSHAWDISSLLIKPVQRLMKYPLLLSAIIDETPDAHSDKANLRLARQRMEEVARNVNEGRRRAEVVKEVLTAKKKPVNVSVAASVNLGRMKSLRKASALMGDGNGEAVLVERMQGELKRIDAFAKLFARNVVDWAKMMGTVVANLRVWAVSFGKVIGLSEEQGSEAFDAFIAVVERQLMPLCVDLEAVVNERLLKEIAHLLLTMNQPLKLLASMDEQEPFHYHLMTMNVSQKNRPPPSLLAASTNYLALRGQLAAELPQYVALLHKGLAVFVRRLADIQTQFWGDVRDRWGDLWEMLRVEGEMNAGCDETVGVWVARWAEVDEAMKGLSIGQARKLYQEPAQVRSAVNTLAETQSLGSRRSAGSGGVGAAAMGVLASLDAAPGNPYVSQPFPLAPTTRTRTRGASDASASKRSLGRKASSESLRSGKSSQKPHHPQYQQQQHQPLPPQQQQQQQQHQGRRKTDDFGEYVAVTPVMGTSSPIPIPTHPMPMIPRTKSMPLPNQSRVAERERDKEKEKAALGRSSSGSAKMVLTLGGGADVERDARRGQLEVGTTYDDRDRDRGRITRKQSFKRKFTDSLRPVSGAGLEQGRSRSSNKSLGSPTNGGHFFAPDLEPPPNPNSNTFPNSGQRDSWANKRAKYVCQVVHACKPPAVVSYFSFPFFTLTEGELYEVLQEAGHPSVHPKLPLYVDDGEDCLLLCRDEMGNVGWALASFLAPLGFE